MTSKKQSVAAKFEIAAQVVFRLGEELITDVVQALVELVKNSYDADASWVRVAIKSPDRSAPSDSNAHGGFISVEDNGHGMGESDFRRGWLTIARSPKRETKARGDTTKRGRTPIGDKGLGRLGVQRLGHDVVIRSRVPDPERQEIEVAFSWRDFLGAKTLSEVPVELVHRPRSKRRSGTVVLIGDLKDPHQWTGAGAREELQKRLAELLSPFREVRDFEVSVSIDGEDLPIAALAEQVREAAVVRYAFTFDGTILTLDGRVQLGFLTRAQAREDKQLLQDRMRRDQGKEFFVFSEKNPRRGRPPSLQHNADSKWVFSFQYSDTMHEMDGIRMAGRAPADPGPFHGEIDYLLLDSDEYAQHVWDSQAEFRKYVAELSGVRVYRDGFGIHLGEDWLNLGRQQTSGGSQYSLRPKNVIGYVALSAKDNQNLLETTSREGFQRTPHYHNFYALLQRVVHWTSRAQEYLRRSALDYLGDAKQRAVGVDPAESDEEIHSRLRRKAQDQDRRERVQRKVHQRLQSKVAATRSGIDSIASDDEQLSLHHTQELEKLEGLLFELTSTLEGVGNELATLDAESEALASAEELLGVLERRRERTLEELELFYEGVALGLTAEALSHEIAAIADRLAKKASQIVRHLARLENRDPKVAAFVEHVKSSVAGLRRQLAHLDPSLRYVREQRVKIPVSAEVQTIEEFYRDRLSANDISISIELRQDFSIRMNRGKFNQVLDNLILNSEYWLREAARRAADGGGSRRGVIQIEVDRPHVRIADDGPGVPLSVEDTLFDPFVTTKAAGRGRGLGLFIVRQLLDADGCAIALLLERNSEGRRFKFELDLSGALDA